MFSVVTTDSLDVGLKLVGTFSVASHMDRRAYYIVRSYTDCVHLERKNS
jgi:hypothetical protein